MGGAVRPSNPSRRPVDLNPALKDEALRLFGQRVRMFGMLQRNAKGQSVRLKVEGIEILPDLALVPHVRFEDLAGAAPNWTEGLGSVEWVREQRRAENG